MPRLVIVRPTELTITEENKTQLFTPAHLQNTELWEQAYATIMDRKYAKNSRNFSLGLTGSAQAEPHLYIIPRVRAGPSYKEVELEFDRPEQIQFCPISKGYSMQDVSSFTLGPVVGHGLCVVNAAFSKIVAVKHIEGGGRVNLKRKNLWQRARQPLRQIEKLNEEEMLVDGVKHNINEWLSNHRDLWFEQWNQHRQLIALHKMGDFHWMDDSPTLSFYHQDRWLSFVEWKRQCYILPAYHLFVQNNRVINFLWQLFHQEKISLGLVHPKGRSEGAEKALTKEMIAELYHSPETMCCMPYVVAGFLLGVPI